MGLVKLLRCFGCQDEEIRRVSMSFRTGDAMAWCSERADNNTFNCAMKS